MSRLAARRTSRSNKAFLARHRRLQLESLEGRRLLAVDLVSVALPTSINEGGSATLIGNLDPNPLPVTSNLKMWLDVDTHRYQNGSTATMIFGVAHIIAYLSRFMSLEPGDVISTGTPPGVGLGQKPPVYLKGGEVMRLGIEGLGTQTQKVVRT